MQWFQEIFGGQNGKTGKMETEWVGKNALFFLGQQGGAIQRRGCGNRD